MQSDSEISDSEATSEPETSAVPKQPDTREIHDLPEEVSDLVEPYIAAEVALRRDPEISYSLEDVAVGAALEDLNIQALEFAENGMVQRGEPELISATPLESEVDADPPSISALVCLDYRSVEYLTPDGHEIKDPDAQSRVPRIVKLDRVEDRWLVAEVTFPDEDEC